MTFFWSACLVSMLNYVVSSVIGVEFNFMNGIYVSLAFSVIVLIIGAIIPNDPVEHSEHH